MAPLPSLAELGTPPRLLARQLAATHCGLLLSTFSKLVQTSIFPGPVAGTNAWHPEPLDRVIELLHRDGLPWKGSIKKSDYKPLPYTAVVWRKRVDDAPPRPHARWQHGAEHKPLKHPLNSPAYVAEWFKLERSLRLAGSGSENRDESKIVLDVKRPHREQQKHSAPARSLDAPPRRREAGRNTEQKINTVPSYVDLARLCHELSISERTVDAWLRMGLLPPPRQRGHKRLWKWSEVELWLDGGPPGMAESAIDAEAERIRNATVRLAAPR